MSVIPYLSQGQGVEVDPLTGLPKKKKQASPFRPGTMNLTPGQGLAQSNQIAAGFSPNLATAQYGGMPSGLPGASGGAPSNQPDYKALIQAALGPLSAQLGAEGVADLTGRNNQFVRALGQFGEQFDLGQANQAFGPEFVGEAGLGELLPQANALAAQTTGAGVSYQARASKARKDAVRQIRNILASRGLLRSGELGYQLQEQQTAFDTGQYDARQQLQDYLTAVNQGYVEAQRQRALALDAATREEAARQAALNPMSGTSAAQPYSPAAVAPVASGNVGSAGSLLAPFRNGYVDNTVTRQKQLLADLLRKYLAA